MNPSHFDILAHQKKTLGLTKGCIVTNANCSTTGIAIPFKALEDNFGPLETVMVTTMQAISGAGYPGVSSLDILDNVVPHIGGEEEKIEWELAKILGGVKDNNTAFDHHEASPMKVSAQCNRVPVLDGHMECCSVRFARRPAPSPEAVKEALRKWRCEAQEIECPSAPDQAIFVHDAADRPQPRLDRYRANGAGVDVGRVRECPVLDLRFVVLSHNALIGAATSSIINVSPSVMICGYHDCTEADVLVHCHVHRPRSPSPRVSFKLKSVRPYAHPCSRSDTSAANTFVLYHAVHRPCASLNHVNLQNSVPREQDGSGLFGACRGPLRRCVRLGPAWPLRRPPSTCPTSNVAEADRMTSSMFCSMVRVPQYRHRLGCQTNRCSAEGPGWGRSIARRRSRSSHATHERPGVGQGRAAWTVLREGHGAGVASKAPGHTPLSWPLSDRTTLHNCSARVVSCLGLLRYRLPSGIYHTTMTDYAQLPTSLGEVLVTAAGVQATALPVARSTWGAPDLTPSASVVRGADRARRLIDIFAEENMR